MRDVDFCDLLEINGVTIDGNFVYEIGPMYEGAGSQVSDFDLIEVYYYTDDADLVEIKGDELENMRKLFDTERRRVIAWEKWNS